MYLIPAFPRSFSVQSQPYTPAPRKLPPIHIKCLIKIGNREDEHVCADQIVHGMCVTKERLVAADLFVDEGVAGGRSGSIAGWVAGRLVGVFEVHWNMLACLFGERMRGSTMWLDEPTDYEGNTEANCQNHKYSLRERLHGQDVDGVENDRGHNA